MGNVLFTRRFSVELPIGTESNPLLFVSQADTLAEGLHWIKVSPTTAKEVYFVKNTNGLAWAVVMHRTGSAIDLHTTNAVGTPQLPPSTINGSIRFKLSDAEMNYMSTVGNNPDVVGVMLIPNYQQGFRNGNLLRSTSGAKSYPIGSSNSGGTVGHMAKYNINNNPATQYPTSWQTSLSSNAYCGDNQPWANFDNSLSYAFRWNSSGGCMFSNEGFNNLAGAAENSTTANAWALLR
jgi:hypothetical protein